MGIIKYRKLVRDFAYRVQFCIIQQKRGILLKKYSRDESYIERLEYNYCGFTFVFNGPISGCEELEASGYVSTLTRH